MATTAICTPTKSHRGLFSTKTAGGRMPLTPSPRARTSSAATAVNVSAHSSPFTPPRPAQSIHKTEQTSHFHRSVSRSVSKFPYAQSPKSNIARNRHSPKHLELGVSDFTLVGTGPGASTPLREKSTHRDAVGTVKGWQDHYIACLQTLQTGLFLIGARVKA